jgi:hypothetical protein
VDRVGILTWSRLGAGASQDAEAHDGIKLDGATIVQSFMEGAAQGCVFSKRRSSLKGKVEEEDNARDATATSSSCSASSSAP